MDQRTQRTLRQYGIPVHDAEVAGDAALLIDPTDTAAVGEAMRRLLTDPGTRDELRAKGRDRLKLFSWDACAQQVAYVFEKVA